jgi:hypothetical protein
MISLVAQASACGYFKSARISKQVWLRRELRTHGIEFYVSNDAVPLLRGPHPAIERLVLPKRLTRSAEQPIGLSRRHSLHILRDLWRWSFWFDQKVHVIWHDDKCDQVVQGSDSRAIANDPGHTLGYSRLLEPGRAQRCALEFTVGRSECAPIAAGRQREGSVESKGNEQLRSFGLKVREVAAVFHAILVAGTVGISQFFHRLKPVLPGGHL